MNKLAPEDVLAALSPGHPELAAVADADALLRYFRARPAPPQKVPGILGVRSDPAAEVIVRADGILAHRILARDDVVLAAFGPQDYGPDIDWGWNPVRNVNWLACMARFTWDEPLATAWAATADERYAAGWVRLTDDWIGKHCRDFSWTAPLQSISSWQALQAEHPPAKDALIFAYLPLQVGVRSMRWCADFEHYLRAAAFTSDFLLRFLAAVHDQAEKAAQHAQLQHHNGTIVELLGLIQIATVFPEFRQARQWLGRGLAMLNETLAAQVLPDGVQREYNVNYHMGVLGWLLNLVEHLRANNCELAAAAEIEAVAERMADYTFAALSPDLLYPMFGDPRRPAHPISASLERSAAVFARPQYTAVLERRRAGYPAELSRCYAQGGMYFLRSGWDEDAVYVPIHCSPPTTSSHDQPDNGTFELHAFRRWLMPDSGCYSYNHGNPEAVERPWFCRTASHQTMTLDDANSVNAATHLLWHSEDHGDVVAFANQSYPTLLHRRTVFFPGRAFLVLVDEALGTAEGDIALHFQFCPGPYQVRPDLKQAFTRNADDANVLLWTEPTAEVVFAEEYGQTSSQFHIKERRPAFTIRHLRRQPPVRFVTVVVPFRGAAPPSVTAAVDAGAIGDAELQLTVSVGHETWGLRRDLDAGAAALSPKPSHD